VNSFDEDIRLVSLSETEFEVNIADSWKINVGPNGGYIAAILLHGMKQAIGEILTRSFTCHFLSASVPGPALLKVHIEKKGRTLSSVTSQLHQNGKSIAFAIATFANDLVAPAFNDIPMPQVKRPAAIPLEERMVQGSPMFVPFRAKYDQRPAIGPKLGNLSDKARVGGWTKFSEERPFDDLAILAISDSWYPSIKGKSNEDFHTPTVDHSIHFLAKPADANSEFLLVMFETEVAANGYLVEDGCIWNESGLLLARSRQLAILLPKNPGDI